MMDRVDSKEYDGGAATDELKPWHHLRWCLRHRTQPEQTGGSQLSGVLVERRTSDEIWTPARSQVGCGGVQFPAWGLGTRGQREMQLWGES